MGRRLTTARRVALGGLAIAAAAPAALASGAVTYPRISDRAIQRAGGTWVVASEQFMVESVDITTGVSGQSSFGCPRVGKKPPTMVPALVGMATGDGTVYVALNIHPRVTKGDYADDWIEKPADTTVCEGILARAMAAGMDLAKDNVMGIARAPLGLKGWELMPAVPMGAQDTFFGLATDATGAPWAKAGPSPRNLAAAPDMAFDDTTGQWVARTDGPAYVASQLVPQGPGRSSMWLSDTAQLDVLTQGTDIRRITTINGVAPQVSYTARTYGTLPGARECRVPRTVRVKMLASLLTASADGTTVLGRSVEGVRVRCVGARGTTTAAVRSHVLQSTDGGQTWRLYPVPGYLTMPLWIDGPTTYGLGVGFGCSSDALRAVTGTDSRKIACAPPWLPMLFFG